MIVYNMCSSASVVNGAGFQSTTCRRRRTRRPFDLTVADHGKNDIIKEFFLRRDDRRIRRAFRTPIGGPTCRWIPAARYLRYVAIVLRVNRLRRWPTTRFRWGRREKNSRGGYDDGRRGRAVISGRNKLY